MFGLFGNLSCELFLTLSLTIMICAITLYFCYVRFIAIDRTLSNQGNILTNLLNNMHNNISLTQETSSSASKEALNAAINYNKIDVSENDDDDDDDDDDEAPPLPPPLFPLVLLFPFDFPNPRLFCFVLAFLVLGLFVSSLLLSPRVRLCLITFVGRPFSSFRTSIRRGLRSAVGMVLVLLLPLR